jgi:hypothetical protein
MMSGLCRTCEDCLHVFVDGQALADHRCSRCKKADLTLHSVCAEHGKTKGLAESPFIGEDTLVIDRMIHEVVYSKGAVDGVELVWVDVWVRLIAFFRLK